MLVDLGGLFDRLYFPNILSHSDRPHADTPSPYMQKQYLITVHRFMSHHEHRVWCQVADVDQHIPFFRFVLFGRWHAVALFEHFIIHA